MNRLPNIKIGILLLNKCVKSVCINGAHNIPRKPLISLGKTPNSYRLILK